MSPRLPSAITSRPISRAWAHTDSSAAAPSAPSASKNATCGLTATTYGATASTMPRQKRSTAAAAAAPSAERLAAELDRQQVDARVEPDDELAALALDRLCDAIGERGHGDGLLGHAANGTPSTAEAIAASVERHHRELGRRSPQERGHREHLVRVLGSERRRRPPRLCDACSRLDEGPAAARQQPLAGDAAARSRRTPSSSPARGRARAHTRSACERGRARRARRTHLLEGGRSGRAAGRRPRSAARGRAAQARREAPGSAAAGSSFSWPSSARAAAAATRRRRSGPSGPGSDVDLPAAARAAQVDVPVGSRAASVGRRSQLPQQPELDERRLELGAASPATRPRPAPRAPPPPPVADASPAKYDRRRVRRLRARPT